MIKFGLVDNLEEFLREGIEAVNIYTLVIIASYLRSTYNIDFLNTYQKKIEPF